MAPTFRYRYVDIGTVFTGDSRRRDTQAVDDSPSTLFSNELACDVGGTSWGENQPLAIIDRHSSQRTQSPSASVAVLQKSMLIREKFARVADVVWLVTHREPDFDAFCSMYLARWMIENNASVTEGASYEQPDEWLNPDLSRIPAEHHWGLLLASYASMLDMRRHIPCPREKQLNSIFYAAIKRGRNFLSPTSGATELFDEIRISIVKKQLNPVFDSVLEANAEFGPELAMLQSEAKAYQHDVQRSRKALVYLPEAEAPSPDFFQHSKKATHPSSSDGTAESLLLADTFRIATDGIYLRDPECSLFQEWARVDTEASVLAAGFEFTAIAYPNRRPEGSVNTTEYVFSIDPERANGRHLYTVWSRVQTEEVEALRLRPASSIATASGSSALESLLSDPWLGGDNRSSTLVVPPRHGTSIGPPGSRSDLRDDAVVEAVRTELENTVYTAASLVAGPQIAIRDLAGLEANEDTVPRHFELNAPLGLPPLEKGYFRFANVGLRSDVPFGPTGGRAAHLLARQIGETLWQALYPETPGETPEKLERHLLVSADGIGVWSERGIAIAQKPALTSISSADVDCLEQFGKLVSLVRGIDRLATNWEFAKSSEQGQAIVSRRTTSMVQALVADGEDLARHALEVQHALVLPDQELLRRFSEAIGFEQLVARLHDINQAAAENIRRDVAAEEGRRHEKTSDVVTGIRQKVGWLEVVVVGFVALELVTLVLRTVALGAGSREALALFGAPLAFGCAAWLLQPWRKKRGAGPDGSRGYTWILIAALLVLLTTWWAQLLQWW